jgi:hypothetical protein
MQSQAAGWLLSVAMLLAVVRPVLEYGATVWHANAPQQAALESVQHQNPDPEQHDWLPQHH